MESQSPMSAASVPSGRDVLVVEDEPRIRNMLSKALLEMGFHATLAASAEAGQRALGERSYDIMILDLNLPGMNGIDFLQRARKQHKDIQVIILTGFGSLEAAQKAIHLDVVEFLTKPCALGTLEAALARAAKRRRGQIVEQGAAPEARMQFDPEPKPVVAVAPPVANAAGDPASMEEMEQRHILGVLQKNNGNRAATAAELGISLRKLYYRLGQYQKMGVVIP